MILDVANGHACASLRHDMSACCSQSVRYGTRPAKADSGMAFLLLLYSTQLVMLRVRARAQAAHCTDCRSMRLMLVRPGLRADLNRTREHSHLQLTEHIIHACNDVTCSFIASCCRVGVRYPQPLFWHPSSLVAVLLAPCNIYRRP